MPQKRYPSQPTIPVKLPFAHIQISVQWTDGIGIGGKNFTDVYDLADFLNANPEFAKALKYETKPR